MSGHRDWAPSSEEHRPITYWGGHAVYATHLVVIAYCALMIVAAVGGRSFGGVLDGLMFRSSDVLAGQVWRIATYGLFNYPSLDFAFSMLMLFWFGRELERHYGRKVFLQLYGGIYLVPTLVLSVVGLVYPSARLGQPGALAVFVAFATQFPGLPVFFTLLAKWAAIILVGLFTLIHLADRDWVSLLLLAATCGFAHAFIRYQQGELNLPRLSLFTRRSRPPLRTLPDPQPAAVRQQSRPTPRRPAPEPTPVLPAATAAEVDALLDKIARSGIASLTPAERARLEAAREDLLRRNSGRD
jgi:membrane associated rhomboid family serine protease